MAGETNNIYEGAEPCGASREAIESLASDFAEKVGLSPGQPLHSLVNQLGGTIEYLTFDNVAKHDNESILIETDGKFKIFLPPYTTEERDRFTIAHELGHRVLHFPLRKNSDQRMAATRATGSRVEWEANWFAVGLLMPEEKFRTYCDSCKSLGKVASHFRVSATAARIRADSLGINLA